MDSLGNLYISDPRNSRVVYATAQGEYLGEIDGFGLFADLALDSTDDLFVAEYHNCVVDEYTNNITDPQAATATPALTPTITPTIAWTLMATLTPHAGDSCPRGSR